MTRIVNIIIGILFITVLACNNMSNRADLTEPIIVQTDSDKSNLTFVDGMYHLDTNAILSNGNLKEMIYNLEREDLVEKKKVCEIPLFIMTFLDSLTNGFRIAEPGCDWQVGCTAITVTDKKGNVNHASLPPRQLVYFGFCENLALMAYYSGGIGKSEHIVIFKYENSRVIDFWCGNVLVDLDNKTSILKYLRENEDKEWGLNTNILRL